MGNQTDNTNNNAPVFDASKLNSHQWIIIINNYRLRQTWKEITLSTTLRYLMNCTIVAYLLNGSLFFQDVAQG